MYNSKISHRNIENNTYDIETFDITKKYKLKGKNNFITALSNVNLKIKKGEIFGLLGPNGAGKTTLVSILTTIIQPTSGYAIILNHDLLKETWFIKEKVGLMFGGEMLYYRLTGYRNLKFFCKLYGINDYKTKILELVEKLNLEKWLDQYVSSYSTGMKLKLALARVLLTDPKILFLDEPMLGLDPKTVLEVIEILKNLNKTILLTSHQMDVVENLCDRIGFLKEGKILKVDTQENFKKLISEEIGINLKVTNKIDDLINSLKNLPFVKEIKKDNNELFFIIDNDRDFPALFNCVKDYPVVKLNEIRPKLEDVFIKFSK